MKLDEETVRNLTVAAKFIVLLALLDSGRVLVIMVGVGWLVTLFRRIKND